jgi:hypothetical protein
MAGLALAFEANKVICFTLYAVVYGYIASDAIVDETLDTLFCQHELSGLGARGAVVRIVEVVAGLAAVAVREICKVIVGTLRAIGRTTDTVS